MHFLVLHGPNLNLFGRREPHIYGDTTLAQIDAGIAKLAQELDIKVTTIQSNHEGALVNPAGLTQHGVPLHDAIKAMPFPVVEVHMSNIAAREPWRAHSIISPAVRGTVQGLGPQSYLAGLRALCEIVRATA